MNFFANLAVLAALTPSASIPAPAAATASRTACALLTSAEIRDVARGPLKSTKPMSHSEGGLEVSQCFFEVEPFTNSVSLEIVRRDSASAPGRGPAARWREIFHAERNERKEAQSERESERGSARPEPVSGVGEEAFWIANRAGGALYVLQKNAYLRISVGGKADAAAKLEESRALARKALQKL